jgi:hypothetical protein
MYILRPSDEKEKIKNTLFRRVAQITVFYYYKTVHLFVHKQSRIIEIFSYLMAETKDRNVTNL